MSATATTQPASGNFVARLWRGDVSLGKTYWVFGVLAGVVLRILTWPIKYEAWSHAGLMSRFDILTILYGWAAIVILYSIFILVAIWRSSTKYRGFKPASKINAILAKTACVLGAIAIIFTVGDIFSAKGDILANIYASAHSRMEHDSMIAELNADLPKKVDRFTTLTKVDADQSGFKYFATISTPTKVNKAMFAQDMKRTLINRVCKDQEARDNLNRSLSYNYVYVDSNANPLAQVLITKADCPAG